MIDNITNPYWNSAHHELQNTLRNFIENEIKEIWYSPQRDGDRFPWEARKASARADLCGIDIPCIYGGKGLDLVSQGIAFEECGRLDVDARELIGSGHASMIVKYASEESRKYWIPKILSGDVLIGVGLTESSTGSDIHSITTKIIKDGKNITIRGQKSYISRIRDAKGFIIFGKTDKDIDNNTLTAVVINFEENKNKIDIEDIETMGLRGWSYGKITINDVPIKISDFLGNEGKGYQIFEEHFSNWRVFMSLLCIGSATKAIEVCFNYLKSRSAFNNPILRYSSILLSLSDIMSRLYASRLLCYQSLWLRDNNIPNTAEAAMSKLISIDYAFKAVDMSIQFMGARGYSKEYDLEKRLRDIRGFMIADGPNDIMKGIVSRELFGREWYNLMIGKKKEV